MNACRICIAAAEATAPHGGAYIEACSDDHTDSAIRLAEAIGASIWGDDPVPPENLAVHLDPDALTIMAEVDEGHGWVVQNLNDFNLGDMNGFSVFIVNGTWWGYDPNAEGINGPTPLHELIELAS